MADSKITALTALTAADPVNDMFPIVDVSDTTMAASGTTKKISVNNILGASGTATLASATITGDLTVDTSTLKVDSTNNRVGIGTASPSVPLYVTGNNATATTIMQDETNGAKLRLLANSINFDITNGGGGGEIAVSGANPLTFKTNGTERARIDSSGNVGIGVTPSAWAAGYKAIQISSSQSAALMGSGNQTELTTNAFYDGAWKYQGAGTVAASRYSQQSGVHYWFTAAAGAANATITDFATAKMTLDASGRLFVGKTSSSAANTGCELQTGTGGNAASVFTADAGSASIMNRLTSDGTIIDFRRETLSVGNIAVTTLATTYNSISDYRLKEAVQPLVGGLARVSALKPSIYKWKVNGSDGEGFLAHELASVVSAAVTGEKDAVNEDGSINAQSIDMSRIVPILVAAIQELTARVQTLEAR